MAQKNYPKKEQKDNLLQITKAKKENSNRRNMSSITIYLVFKRNMRVRTVTCETGGRSPREEARATIWEWISAIHWCKLALDRFAWSTLRRYTSRHSCSISRRSASRSSSFSPISSQINYQNRMNTTINSRGPKPKGCILFVHIHNPGFWVLLESWSFSFQMQKIDGMSLSWFQAKTSLS